MQQTAENAPSSSFAGMLASLTAPARKRSPDWDDELAEDVINLSYERALSTHARYRSSARDDRSLTDLPDPEPPRAATSQPLAPRVSEPLPPKASPVRPVSEPISSSPAHTERRKDASITIRLSAVECEQLHQRAAEAGLTLSAYLRSCTLEVETLRTLVKSTLAQLQAAQQLQAPTAPVAALRAKPRSAWLRNLLPQRSRAARA
jgi:Mobilization protein NikA